MANATYVVVIEYRPNSHTKKSWSVGPYHIHNKAESAVEALPSIAGLNAWIEPVIRPDEYLAAIEQVFNETEE